jgi:hypothetical protein
MSCCLLPPRWILLLLTATATRGGLHWLVLILLLSLPDYVAKLLIKAKCTFCRWGPVLCCC